MRNLALSILTLAAVSAAGTGLYAHSGATGVVKQRMELMKDIAAEMKAMHAMATGRADFDGMDVAARATWIADHGVRIPETFPEGSRHGPSEATAAIWQDWDGFTAAAEKMSERARAVAAAGKAGDREAFEDRFRDLGRSCGGCHRTFREKKR